MKYVLVLAMLMLTACQSNTEYGLCVGLVEKQNPKLEYNLSARNIILGVFFSQLIIPPALVLVNETYCPVGNK